MLAEVINFEEQAEKKRKTCKYKGVVYPVMREKELSKIQLVIDGKTVSRRTHRYYIIVDDEKLYLNYDGNKVCNKQPGIFSTVEFLNKKEIEIMKEVFKEKIKSATTPTNELIAWKNYTLFGCGINVGLRASDLRRLKWSDVYDDNWNRKVGWEFYSKKTNKRTVIVYNDAFFEYLEAYKPELIRLRGIPKLKSYIFFSKKNDEEPISENTMWKIMNDTAGKTNIEKKIGSHTLRKTFGRHIYDAAKDKTAIVTQLQRWFKHSSSTTTLTYIGITVEEDIEMVQSIHL